MKVLLVAPSLRRGGAERVAAALTRAWSREHEVLLAVFNAAERAYAPGGRLIDLQAPPARGRPRAFWRWMQRVVRLRALLLRERPDRVIGFMESAGMPLLVAATVSGFRRRLTLSLRGNPDHLEGFQKLFVRLFYGLAARLVFPSRGAAERAGALLGLAADRIEVIPSPLDLEEISVRAGEGAGGAASPEGHYFFAAGRLVPGKDFARMLRIFSEADTGGARLILAGGGPERPRLEALARSLGLAERVRFLGETENPFRYMQGAIAFLMTSRHEGFPMVLIEAFACGCPVVAFDCDFGPREAVRDGENGFLIALGENRLFADRLETLAADPEGRRRLGLAARRRAEDFEIGRVAGLWLKP